MSEPDPSASPSPSPPLSARPPSELSSKQLRRAIAAQAKKYDELRQQPGAGQRAWWNAKILSGLVAEQHRRRSRHRPRPRDDGSPAIETQSPSRREDGE